MSPKYLKYVSQILPPLPSAGKAAHLFPHLLHVPYLQMLDMAGTGRFPPSLPVSDTRSRSLVAPVDRRLTHKATERRGFLGVVAFVQRGGRRSVRRANYSNRNEVSSVCVCMSFLICKMCLWSWTTIDLA